VSEPDESRERARRDGGESGDRTLPDGQDADSILEWEKESGRWYRVALQQSDKWDGYWVLLQSRLEIGDEWKTERAITAEDKKKMHILP
jgi:hypothetical protein